MVKGWRGLVLLLVREYALQEGPVLRAARGVHAEQRRHRGVPAAIVLLLAGFHWGDERKPLYTSIWDSSFALSASLRQSQ